MGASESSHQLPAHPTFGEGVGKDAGGTYWNTLVEYSLEGLPVVAKATFACSIIDLQEQLQAASFNQGTFLRPRVNLQGRPLGTAPLTDVELYLATNLLDWDRKLAEQRRKLVPGVASEEMFWNNYFHLVRVVVLRMFMLSPAAENRHHAEDYRPFALAVLRDIAWLPQHLEFPTDLA